MFEGLGMPELILIVVVFLIFFGPKKIPEMAQGIGKGIREFRKSIKEVQNDIEETTTSTAALGPVDREHELIKRELELAKREEELRQKTAAS
jgi:sec-independent protein translocase protein TatA